VTPQRILSNQFRRGQALTFLRSGPYIFPKRDECRLEGSHGKGQNLRRIQDQIRAAGDNERQTKYIRKAVELAFGFTAKLEQVDFLWSLIFDREDRILIAKTGYGKSVVPQLPLSKPI
jgi:hypothetical protein